MSLLAALVAGTLSLKPRFDAHWKAVTFALCMCMVAAWTFATLTAGQQVQLFVGALVVLTASCCLIPWKAQWHALLTAGCVACCAVNTVMVRPASPYIAYLWLDLASGAILTLVSSRLWENWRAALVQSNHHLRAEIDEREAAQKKLEEGEATLRRVLDANGDLVTIVRLSDGRYVYVNEAFLEQGFQREDVLGKSAAELKMWGDDEDRERFSSTLTAQGFVRNFEAAIRMKDGRSVPHLISSVVVDLNGEHCLLSVARDITDLKKIQNDLMATVTQLRETQKRLRDEIEERERTIIERQRAESQLRESEAKLRKIFEACPETICINSMVDGRYIECNSRFFESGYDRNEVVSASSQSLGVWASHEQFRKFATDLNANGIVRNMEANFRQKDGAVVPCLISGAVIELNDEPAR